MAAPLGRALVEAVRAAATEQPVVLAVDDAQWLDADSALSLGSLLRDLYDVPLTLVLVTAPYPPRPELDELRSRLGRDLDGGVVTLRRLDRAALRHLAERMLPGYDPISLDRVVRRVATDSGGLPLFAVELLRAVALGLDLGTIAGTWPEPLRTLDQSLPGDLPDAVVAAIRVAFRRLSPAAQRVLVSAAVLGDLAAPAVLERALEMEADTAGPRAGRAGVAPLAGVRAAGVLVRRDGSCGRWCSGRWSRPASGAGCWRRRGNRPAHDVRAGRELCERRTASI